MISQFDTPIMLANDDMTAFYDYRYYFPEMCSLRHTSVVPTALSHLAINKQHTFAVSQTLKALTQSKSDR